MNLSSEWQDLSIAHSYGQYGIADLFKKYSNKLGKSENPLVLLEYGVDLILMNEYGNAIKVFNNILDKINDGSAEFSQIDRLYFNIGHAFHELNRLYDAKKYYYRCLDENINFNKAKVNLGNIYRIIGDFDRALGFSDDVLEGNPEFYEALYNKAILLGYMKNFEEADTLFNKIKFLKDSKHVFYDKALMYYDTNKMMSLIELSNIEIIDENDARALFFMILIYVADKQIELADERYGELIKISDDLDYKLRVASEYYNNGYERESLEILDELKSSDDINEKYESLLLYSKLIANSNIQESFRIWDNILKSNAPKEFKSRAYVNKYLWSNHRNKKNLDNALRLDIKNEKAHLNYAVHYATKKQWKKAMKRVNYGLKMIPNSQELYFLKGRINLDQKHIKEAVKHFKTALKIDLPKIKIYVHLFFCYLALEDPENTSKYFNYAVNLDGNYNSTLDYDELLNNLIEKYIPHKY